MKKIYFHLLKLIASIALTVTTIGVNSTCTLFNYQSELPVEAKKLRDF